MSRDTELLNAIQTYFDALYACDLSLFDQVFHPASSLFDADEGAITVDPIADYRQVIAKRESPSSRSQEREDEIILIDWLSPAAATVKVSDTVWPAARLLRAELAMKLQAPAASIEKLP